MARETGNTRDTVQKNPAMQVTDDGRFMGGSCPPHCELGSETLSWAPAGGGDGVRGRFCDWDPSIFLSLSLSVSPHASHCAPCGAGDVCGVPGDGNDNDEDIPSLCLQWSPAGGKNACASPPTLALPPQLGLDGLAERV